MFRRNPKYDRAVEFNSNGSKESLLAYYRISLQILQCTTCPCFQRYVCKYIIQVQKKKVPRSKKTCIPHSSMWKFIHLQLVRTSLGRCVLDVVQRHVSSDLFNVLHLGRTSVATPREPRQGPPSPGRCPSKVPESHRAWNATGCGEGASRELMSLNGDFMRS